VYIAYIVVLSTFVAAVVAFVFARFAFCEMGAADEAVRGRADVPHPAALARPGRCSVRRDDHHHARLF
jgi:hypothetical protein